MHVPTYTDLPVQRFRLSTRLLFHRHHPRLYPIHSRAQYRAQARRRYLLQLNPLV
jgi:hypothetical protein